MININFPTDALDAILAHAFTAAAAIIRDANPNATDDDCRTALSMMIDICHPDMPL